MCVLQRKMMSLFIGIALTVVPTLSAVVDSKPYLQALTESSVWVSWINDKADETPQVQFGIDSTNLTTVTGSVTKSTTVYNYHTVQVTGLNPNTRYYYRVINNVDTSVIYHFRTMPPKGVKTGHFRAIVLGDHQVPSHGGYDTMLIRVGEKCTELYGKNWHDSVQLIVNDGDQVDKGTDILWKTHHFDQSKRLSPYLPIQTSVGNHETYSDSDLKNYRKYIIADQLLYKGVAQYSSEASYAYQAGPALFLMLNSEDNSASHTAFVNATLDSAKKDSDVQWIFAVNHRGYQAEQYVGDISQWFRNTVAPKMVETGKTALLIGGHHHLYARGQMKETPVYHVLNGGASWAQDWGMSNEQDFDDVQKTRAEWSWQLVDIDLDNEKMQVRNYRTGHTKLGNVYKNDLTDEFILDRKSKSPATPSLLNLPKTATFPLVLTSSPYAGNGYDFNSTEFQVSASKDFSVLKHSKYRDFENIFGTTGAPNHDQIDKNRGVNIFADTINSGVLPDGKWFVRLRHRDRSLNWSAWSPTDSFVVSGTGQIVESSIKLAKTAFAVNEDISVVFDGAPGNKLDWIGLYEKGKVPGAVGVTSASWKYTDNSSVGTAGKVSGTVVLNKDIPANQYVLSLFKDNGYTKLCTDIQIYIGSVPELSPESTWIASKKGFAVNYDKAPLFASDRIGIFRTGTVPSAETVILSKSVATNTKGSVSFDGIESGFYYAVYLLKGTFDELGNRSELWIGDSSGTLSVKESVVPVNTPFEITFANGRGNPKDYIGIYPQGEIPGEGSEILWQYVDGKTAGVHSWAGGIAVPGSYFISLFTNDSYTNITNTVALTVDNPTSVLKEIQKIKSEISIAPNPVLVGDEGVIIRLNNKNIANGAIRIFDMVGNSVHYSEMTHLGELFWDCCNRAGFPVASGTYQCLVTGTFADGKPFSGTAMIGVKR